MVAVGTRSGTPRRRSLVRAGWLLLVSLAALVVGLGPARTDPELARFLLDGGKKALEKRKYDDAVLKLERALREDPALLEAGYWLAFAHDKAGAGPAAVKAYRAFREACRAARESGPLDKALEGLVAKAEARLAALSAAETELARLNAPFVDSMLSLAKAQFLRDAALAERAAQAALALAPDHDEALRLLARLRADRGGSPDVPVLPPSPSGPTQPPARPAGEYKDIALWNDLLGTRGLGSYDSWVYAPKLLTIDRREGGAYYWPTVGFQPGPRYVLEMEVCLRRVDSPRWAVGFGFARDPAGSYLSLFFSRSEVVSLQFQGSAPMAFAKQANIPPVEIDTWHRFVVDVDGANVKVWFDDRVVLEAKVPSGVGLGGGCGLYHQANRCEIRRLRLGTKE